MCNLREDVRSIYEIFLVYIYINQYIFVIIYIYSVRILKRNTTNK